MRQDLGVKTYMYPMPVLIIASYDENGMPDAMNAAWGGISDDDKISMCLSANHKTVKNILARKAFTVAFADAKHVAEADYLGIVSANDVPDKLAECGLHTVKSPVVDAPVIEEFPLAFECSLISYDEQSCIMTGKIENVVADDSILDGEGIDMNAFQPISFDPANSAYRKLGEKVGNAFSDGAKFMK